MRDGEVNYRTIPVFADAIAPDPMAQDRCRARAVRNAAAEVVGRPRRSCTGGNFNGTLDDVICDALLAERDAEIALSPGSAGATCPQPHITREDIYNTTALSHPAAYRLTIRRAAEGS